ncbi:hypothetical protein HDU77_011789 [Chytriomyces hyalinus]|nr:hypothetical protein HDU77_011789 [Chytriomyces hyalinus]
MDSAIIDPILESASAAVTATGTIPLTQTVSLQVMETMSAISSTLLGASVSSTAGNFNLTAALEVPSGEGNLTENLCLERVARAFEPGTLDYEPLMIAWISTMVFGLVSIALTLWLCMRHFQYYYNPQHQRWIVRILIMVPIYSICSSLSFRFFYHSIYFDIIRDCYEAFVIFSFFGLLQQYIGGTLENQHKFMQTIHAPSRMRYPFPLNCFTFNPRGNAFLVNTKICILQYVVVRPIMTIAAYFMEWYGIFCPISMDPRYGSVWVSSINLISVSVAMYALILFYIVIHHEIPERKPLWKFIAVKFVVFFSFWQSIVISILDTAGVIQGTSAWSSDNTSSLIEAFLISFEMIIASCIHIKAFNYKEYIPQHPTNTDGNNISTIPRTRIWAGFWDAINMVDILKDIVGVSSEVKAVKRKRRERRAQRALESRSGSLMDMEMDESEVEVVSVAEVKLGGVVVQQGLSSVGRKAEMDDSNAFVISGEDEEDKR